MRLQDKYDIPIHMDRKCSIEHCVATQPIFMLAMVFQSSQVMFSQGIEKELGEITP